MEISSSEFSIVLILDGATAEYQWKRLLTALQSTVEPAPDYQPYLMPVTREPVLGQSCAARDGVLIGCAGWSIPKEEKPHFPGSGSHLERYAARFSAVEINSSFYRPHRTSTYARWAASVPPDFRFSVKVPKAITHIARLKNTGDLIGTFLAEAGGLGEKLGCLLVQLPPSLDFNPGIARCFFEELRTAAGNIPVAFEPRHGTWFERSAGSLLEEFRISRVAADPPPVPSAAEPGGWHGLIYHRLHGSPRMYYSDYSHKFVVMLAARLADARSRSSVWCIFDNTAEGFAMPNARELMREWKALGSPPSANVD
ncbi:DUF72 domain-containing protein [Luteolibacter yonseiensis]|uniref:DUF72 domain-containing protein n=1 Tax=Luteolibacter yonseiensis TaxID=1144680 RepID=A0A934VBW6_9BACT|nr:DUF72 domain-containing protein [Luteolibacter yonseiensis]MBK1816351.1 DUF72 domain-containing protein [Luteolibacter yonseiensis]